MIKFKIVATDADDLASQILALAAKMGGTGNPAAAAKPTKQMSAVPPAGNKDVKQADPLPGAGNEDTAGETTEAEVRDALKAKIKGGKSADCKKVFEKFGCESVTNLDPAQYGAFLKAIQAIK